MVFSKVDYDLPIEDAKANFWFEIALKHVEKAKGCQLDGEACVIWKALELGLPGFRDGRVGASYTYILLADRIVRYRTPERLKIALNDWDRTSDWKLPKGIYYLLAPSHSKTVGRLREKETVRRQTRKQLRSTRGLAPTVFINPRYLKHVNKAGQ